jgi:hypothetical protein
VQPGRELAENPSLRSRGLLFLANESIVTTIRNLPPAPRPATSRTDTPAAAPSVPQVGTRAQVDGFRPLGAPVQALTSPALQRGPQVGNDFKVSVQGQNPPVAAGGALSQLKQGVLTAHLAASAAKSAVSGGRLPGDFLVQAQLRALGRTGTVAPASSISRIDYSSRIAHAPPRQVYADFVENPERVLGAAGLKVRPGVERLENGMRLMLENTGMPPMWLPVEVELRPESSTIHFHTLDGHMWRGTNSFTFAPDGQGGTRVAQQAHFQGSSPLSSVGVSLMGASERQHTGWEKVHAALFTRSRPAPTLHEGHL